MQLTPGAPRDTVRWRPSSNCPNLESGVERGRGNPAGPAVCVPDEDELGNSNYARRGPAMGKTKNAVSQQPVRSVQRAPREIHKEERQLQTRKYTDAAPA
jgi:hypothetical protein